MKKIAKILLCVMLMSIVSVSAEAEQILHVYKHDVNVKNVRPVNVYIDTLKTIGNEDITLKDSRKIPPNKQEEYVLEDYIANEAKSYEYMVIMDFASNDEENPYPEILSTEVKAEATTISGGSESLGKDYRLLYFEDENSEDLSADITESKNGYVKFTLKKLGKYVIYYDPRIYNIKFYGDLLYVDEDENKIYEKYYELENLGKYDTIVFPPIPEKDGYVFTGWKRVISGGALDFAVPQPNNTTDTKSSYYASWCKEDEYEPIRIEISADEPITKGKENGKKITLKTNYGVFSKNDGLFQSEWRERYEAETNEENKEILLSEWNEKWKVVGADDIMIESVKIIDEKTLEMELSGNSEDKYSSSEIAIEFNGYLLNPEGYDSEDEDVSDTKIKMDKDGVREKMYRSDNTIKLSKQNKHSSGGSLVSEDKSYTVSFDTDGGSEILRQTVKNNSFLTEPEKPQKDGFDFDGWFTDKNFTEKFDFGTKIDKNITLYAKWKNVDKEDNTADNKDDKNDRIVFTVGEKEAIVFGETKQNDVSPIIREDRAFLPASFIAESLGAKVEWNTENQTVTITDGKTEIVITIGSETAFVNGEAEKLEYPAFIEDDRTYTPIRFIAEKLGSKVDWNSDTHTIIITK